MPDRMSDLTLTEKFEAATDKAFTHYDDAVEHLVAARSNYVDSGEGDHDMRTETLQTAQYHAQMAQVHATLFAGLTAAIKTP